MAPKTFSLISFIFLLLLVPFLCHAVLAHSPSEFLKPLVGSRKGDKVKGIKDVKNYLQKLGYLAGKPKYILHSNNQSDPSYDDILDYRTELAIKKYQNYYKLKPTGILDSETVSKMMMPRCGVPDFVNDTNRTRSDFILHLQNHNPSSYHTQYEYFPGNPKWPSSIRILSYAFQPGTRSDVQEPVNQAFQQWKGVTYFTFVLSQDYQNADLQISFQSRDHGDGVPFDGPLGTLAHSFAPTDGRFHYDADENWAVGAVDGRPDMGTVALHEIGHLLGLAHTPNEDAIMYAIIPLGKTKGLNADDIQGIQALYSS